MATLPRDSTEVESIIPAAGAADTMWLSTWAANQPTTLACVAAYRALGLAALNGYGVIWMGLGRSRSCLDD
jgi:hypothetical protein